MDPLSEWSPANQTGLSVLLTFVPPFFCCFAFFSTYAFASDEATRLSNQELLVTLVSRRYREGGGNGGASVTRTREKYARHVNFEESTNGYRVIQCNATCNFDGTLYPLTDRSSRARIPPHKDIKHITSHAWIIQFPESRCALYRKTEIRGLIATLKSLYSRRTDRFRASISIRFDMLETRFFFFIFS